MARGLGLLAVVAVIGAGIVGGVSILSGEPNEIRTTMLPPEITVAPGESFIIELTIENVDLESVDINGIGVEQSLLDGISVLQIDPGYRSIDERNYPLLGEWTEYKYDQTIFGGETLTVLITFQANKVGEYSGDISTWIDSNIVGGIQASQARRAELQVTIQ